MVIEFIDPHGFDAGKLIKGKKRHILVDTLGLLLHAIIHAADIQDRDESTLRESQLFRRVNNSSIFLGESDNLVLRHLDQPLD